MVASVPQVNNMIKNIIFDFGNVIISGNTSDILDRMDLTEEEKEITKKRFIIDNYKNLDLGIISLKDVLDNIELPYELNEYRYDLLYHNYEYREKNQDVLDLAKKLKNNGYKLYILSNHCHEVYNYISNDPLFSIFDGNVVSSEYGVVKPNKEIYEILLNKYNLKSEECFFIDDLKDNIDGANKVGIKGHILEHSKYKTEKLLEDLIENGVNVN